jgi:hypothetical protein
MDVKTAFNLVGLEVSPAPSKITFVATVETLKVEARCFLALIRHSFRPKFK